MSDKLTPEKAAAIAIAAILGLKVIELILMSDHYIDILKSAIKAQKTADGE